MRWTVMRIRVGVLWYMLCECPLIAPCAICDVRSADERAVLL